MVRIQVQLTEQQHEALQAVARRQGVSLAEVIRQAVDTALEQEGTSRAELYARAAELVGSVVDPTGASDVAVEHDRYLSEIYR